MTVLGATHSVAGAMSEALSSVKRTTTPVRAALCTRGTGVLHCWARVPLMTTEVRADERRAMVRACACAVPVLWCSELFLCYGEHSCADEHSTGVTCHRVYASHVARPLCAVCALSAPQTFIFSSTTMALRQAAQRFLSFGSRNAFCASSDVLRAFSSSDYSNLPLDTLIKLDHNKVWLTGSIGCPMCEQGKTESRSVGASPTQHTAMSHSAPTPCSAVPLLLCLRMCPADQAAVQAV